MKNQIYRIDLEPSHKLEFYVLSTNEINPHRETKEMGIVVLEKNVQLDGSLELDELDSLIEYLENCRDYIKEFNQKTKPVEQP